jgi:hypothetical protein
MRLLKKAKNSDQQLPRKLDFPPFSLNGLVLGFDTSKDEEERKERWGEGERKVRKQARKRERRKGEKEGREGRKEEK